MKKIENFIILDEETLKNLNKTADLIIEDMGKHSLDYDSLENKIDQALERIDMFIVMNENKLTKPAFISVVDTLLLSIVISSKNELKDVVRSILFDIDPIITFHDFRVVMGENAKNVLFDVVIPPKYKYSDDDLVNLIKNRVNEAGNGNLYAVVVVDRSYGELKSEAD